MSPSTSTGSNSHASEEHKNIAGDAAKQTRHPRNAHWVWCLAWDDVEAFHTAVTEDPPRIPKFAPYLTGTAKNTAKQRHSRRSVDERIDFDTLDANQMNLLLEYLQRPEDGHWRPRPLGPHRHRRADSPQQVQPESIGGVVQAAADALDPPRAAGSGPLVASWIDDHDLRIGAVLDVKNPDAERWTAFCVLQDTEAHYAEVDTHRPRWRSWLRWSNLLQFLDPHGSAPSIWIAASSESRDLALEDLWIQSDTAEIAAKAEPVAVSRTGWKKNSNSSIPTSPNSCELRSPPVPPTLSPAPRSKACSSRPHGKTPESALRYPVNRSRSTDGRSILPRSGPLTNSSDTSKERPDADPCDQL